MGKYKIYLIEGVKVGCTNNFKRRLKEQGFNEDTARILEEYDDRVIASQREIELQLQYFGKRDSNIPYFKNIVTHTQKTKEKMSIAKRGKIRSEETNKKLSVSMSKSWTQERKDAYREKMKEYWKSKVNRKREKIDNYWTQENRDNYGLKMSEINKTLWTQGKRDAHSKKMKEYWKKRKSLK